MRIAGITCMLLCSLTVHSQINPGNREISYSNPAAFYESKTDTHGGFSWWGLTLKPDHQSDYRLRIPLLIMRAQSHLFQGETYWAGTITTQSYNRGKLGTFYYWDVQGNLRESKFFFDIAGKNKRGLKLVIPRR